MTTAVLRFLPATPASRTDRGLGALTLFGLIALPLVVYYLWLCVTDYGGSLVWPTTLDQLSNWLSRFPLPTLTAVAIYGGWVLLQVILQIMAPGKVREGMPLADGSRLKYKLNGWFSFCFTLA